MCISRVRNFIELNAPELRIEESVSSTGTVAEAAEVFGVTQGQIAKSLTFMLNDSVIMLVMPGDLRLDNRKFKQHFGVKARMLHSGDVERLTGFAPGGVTPLGALPDVNIYFDLALRQYPEVIPAGGSSRSGVRISPERLALITGGKWVDMGR